MSKLSGYLPGKHAREVFFNSDGSLGETLRIGRGGALQNENGEAIGGAPSSHAASHAPGGSDAISGMVTVSGTPVVGDVIVRGPSGWTLGSGIDDVYGNAVISWDASVRFLFDASGIEAINFDNRTLVNNGYVESVSWTDGITVTDTQNIPALALVSYSRSIYDGSGGSSGDFAYRNLVGNTGSPVLNWNDGLGVWDGNGVAAILADSADRVLYDSGGYSSVDFANRSLMNGDGFIDWSDGISVADVYGSPAILANTTSRTLSDLSGVVSVNFNDRALVSTTATQFLRWNASFVQRVDSAAGTGRTTAPMAATGTQSVVPTNGQTRVVGSDSATILTYFLNHTSAIGSLTIDLATWLNSVPDGACITIFTRSDVTALTVTATGYSFVGANASTLAAGASIEYVKVGSSRSTNGTAGQLLRVR